MKPAVVVSKSGALVLVGGFIVWFFSDLINLPASGSLLEKLILTTPVVLALRVSLMVVALGVVGFVVTAFWNGLSIRKIGSEGIEFEKVGEISNKTQSGFAEKDDKIKELERINDALQNKIDELQNFLKNLIAMRGGKS